MNIALGISSEPMYRPRRQHKKSRNGCLSCKQRKTKCDEVTPRCTRCAKRGLCCQYQQRMATSDSGSRTESRFLGHLQPENSQRYLQSPFVPKKSHATSNGGSLLSTSSPFSFQIPSPLLTCEEDLEWSDVELFNHYLTHTSLIIPFDIEDLYALRVGIPNLAFRSKPLMSSILALAAVCKSHDLIEQRQQDRNKILDLLALADQHHRASLLQVQLDLPNPFQYDYVLANATLMVLYASASHCVRIRLAETQTKDEQLPREFIPAQSQWISLIRAAHLAFVGLFNDGYNASEVDHADAGSPPTIARLPSNKEAIYTNDIISPENGPTERTKNLLFPILAASSGPALSALRLKAQTIWKAETLHAENAPDINNSHSSLQACIESLDILSGIVTEVFAAGDSSPLSISCSKQFHSELDIPSLGGLSTVSSWLRSYVARVTSSTTAPRPLRRVIMAFLNRVPAEYLSLVQTTLDSIGVQTDNGQQEAWESSDFEFSNPSAAHKLAIDIFAHWIVLVMLLDGVWWIGGIGAWELRRVVSFVRAQGWLDPQMPSEEYWWPESMYNVGKELGNVSNMNR